MGRWEKCLCVCLCVCNRNLVTIFFRELQKVSRLRIFFKPQVCGGKVPPGKIPDQKFDDYNFSIHVPPPYKIFKKFRKNLEKIQKPKMSKKHENFEFSEFGAYLSPKNSNIHPHYGVGHHEKHIFEARKHVLWPLQPVFRPKMTFSVTCSRIRPNGRKWGLLGEKIDLQKIDSERGLEGRGTRKTWF